MPALPFLSGRSVVERAEMLLHEHGADAARAALAHAFAARARDNAVSYSQWREVERLCTLPQQAETSSTLH
jgi:hypothetical protein